MANSEPTSITGHELTYPELRGRWPSARHIFAFLGFLGFVNVYAMRVNLSVAIVAMVNSTRNGTNDDFNGTCPAPIMPLNSTDDGENSGTFDWDEETQSYVLGSFFYGYVVTQLPGGRLAEVFGGKWIFGLGILTTSVFTILMPVAAKINFGLLIATRVVEGLGEGVTFPVMHAMLAEWAPPLERSRLSTFIYAGSMLGTVISLPLTGLVCDTLGWEAAFYIFGAAGIVWFIFWTLLVFDTPSKHPWISEEERNFIETSLGRGRLPSSPDTIEADDSLVSDLDGNSIVVADTGPLINNDGNGKRVNPLPWRHIFTSRPFWAIMIAHSCQNWGFYTLLTEMPTYMKQILHFDIKEYAFLSAVPYLCMWITANGASYLADLLISRHILSTTATRKILNSIAFFVPALCLVLIYYAKCDKTLVVVLLCTTVGINGFQFSSLNVNHIDIAPNFAGTLLGMTNMTANTMGFLAPMAISHIIENHEDIHHWQIVFYIASGVYIVGNILFVLMASGVEQPWNKIGQETGQTDQPDVVIAGPIIPSTPAEFIGDIY